MRQPPGPALALSGLKALRVSPWMTAALGARSSARVRRKLYDALAVAGGSLAIEAGAARRVAVNMDGLPEEMNSAELDPGASRRSAHTWRSRTHSGGGASSTGKGARNWG